MCRHTHVRFRDEEEEKPSSKPQPEQRSIHFYAVLLVLLCAVKLFKSPGQNNVMCSHVPNIIDDLQVDDFAFSQTFATGTAVAALVQPALGVLLDARGVRFCIPMGLIGLAAGLGGLSLVKPPAPYYQLVASWFLIRSTAIGCIDIRHLFVDIVNDLQAALRLRCTAVCRCRRVIEHVVSFLVPS